VQHLGATGAPSRDGILIFAHRPASGESDLLRLEVPTAAVAWRVAVSSTRRRIEIDGVEVWASGAMAVSADEKYLVVAPAFRSALSEEGLSVIDVSTGQLRGFVGGLRVPPSAQSIVPVSGLPGVAAASFGVLTARHDRNRGADALVILDAATLSVTDSIPLDDPMLFQGDRLQAVTAVQGGRRLYLRGLSGLYAFDLASRTITDRTTVPSRGALWASPDGGTLVVTDPGVWPDFPGSGALFLYDERLRESGRIDLGPDPETGANVVSQVVAWSADGRLMYVTTGTASVGPLYHPQRSRLLTIDVARRTVVSSIPLGDYNARLIFPF
jgi:hypothetical protein